MVGFAHNYLRGQLPPWVFRWILLPAYTLATLATPLIAASRFPGPFDFRRRVITNLASWRDNPDGHWFFGLGLGIMMLLLIPFPGHLSRSLSGSRTLRRIGRLDLWIGILGGLVVALESGAVAGLRSLWGAFGKAHEFYAIVAFAGLGLGGLWFGVCTVQTVLGDTSRKRSARLLISGGALALMVAATLAQLGLYLLSYISKEAETKAGELSFLLNFACWEWISACSLLLLLIAMIRETCSRSCSRPSQ